MRTIYFMGICGTAMGNAALLARSAGYEVVGVDSGVYPPMSTLLATTGIKIEEGYDAERLARGHPDLVVLGNALTRGNPEVEWLLNTREFPFTSLPAFLSEHVLAGRRNIVVAGTHGKTTTTAMTAFLLRENGRDPGYLIGGVCQDPPSGNHVGAAEDPFVIEGDEYDSAFFDKRSKFIHYRPHIAVLNNLEFDHADIFRDLEDVRRSFRHFTRIVPGNGWILLNGDDVNLATLGVMPWTRTLRVGTGADSDLRILDFVESGEECRFALEWKGRLWGKVTLGQPGLFNARNAAMAALAAGLAQYPENPARIDLEPLMRFRGVKRRQELRHASSRLRVVEDFGHHPTAIAGTIRSFRRRYPKHRLRVAFEPRSNTARTRCLEPEFTEALALADAVYLGVVSRADQLPAAERFDTAAVVTKLRERQVEAKAAASNAALLEELQRDVDTYDEEAQLVLFFTNGSFDGIIDLFADAL